MFTPSERLPLDEEELELGNPDASGLAGEEDGVLRPAAVDADDADAAAAAADLGGDVATREAPTIPGEEEIGRLACWTVSSAKPGFGVELLRDGKASTFWQSDGTTPHTVTLFFRRLTTVTTVLLLLHGEEDDSYTPEVVSVSAGTTASDLQVVCTKTLALPTGWVAFKLSECAEPAGRTFHRHRRCSGRGVAAFTFRISVLENHNGGKDVHIRRILVFGPKKAEGQFDSPSSSSRMSMHSHLR